MLLCHIRLLHCSWRQKQQHSEILNEQVNGNAIEMRRVTYIMHPKLAPLDLKCLHGNI